MKYITVEDLDRYSYHHGFPIRIEPTHRIIGVLCEYRDGQFQFTSDGIFYVNDSKSTLCSYGYLLMQNQEIEINTWAISMNSSGLVEYYFENFLDNSILLLLEIPIDKIGDCFQNNEFILENAKAYISSKKMQLNDTYVITKN